MLPITQSSLTNNPSQMKNSSNQNLIQELFPIPASLTSVDAHSDRIAHLKCLSEVLAYRSTKDLYFVT